MLYQFFSVFFVPAGRCDQPMVAVQLGTPELGAATGTCLAGRRWEVWLLTAPRAFLSYCCPKLTGRSDMDRRPVGM